MSKKIDRRSFIKGTVAAGAIAAAVPMAMCLYPAEAKADSRPLPTNWAETVDVLIIGSGLAGLGAAAAAGKAGCKPVILQNMPT